MPGSGKFRCGLVSISGRPSVGKSTFLNTAVGQKISIVTPKPQTTRNTIRGVLTGPDYQIVFVDTPGIHKPLHGLGKHMLKEAKQALKDVDVVIYMVGPSRPKAEDLQIIEGLKKLNKPVVLAINKIDTVKKPDLLPVIKQYGDLGIFNSIIPVSASMGDGVNDVVKTVIGYLPEGDRIYPDDIVTDSYERFLASELIREKVMLATSEEVPHAVGVQITEWQERKAGNVYIAADIYVEKEGQKGIIIGKRGERLKSIGASARQEIEGLLGTQVYLELFVKVVEDWRRSPSVLRDMGFQ